MAVSQMRMHGPPQCCDVSLVAATGLGRLAVIGHPVGGHEHGFTHHCSV